MLWGWMSEIIKNYICNYNSHILSYIPPKCCEEKEPKVEQLCIAVHTITKYTCDANQLDKSGNIVKSSEHCLT